MIFDGLNGGSVELLENTLIIRRKGFASLLTQGLKGEKRIPLSSITSLQFKEPGLTTGYIQFGVVGGIESRGGVFNATTDENTVLFVKKSLNEFRQLKEIVESRIGRPAETNLSSTARSVNFTEELSRLADLRDRGVLTQEEFANEKARLQQQRATDVKAISASSKGSSFRASTFQSESGTREADTPKKGARRHIGMGCLIIIGIIVAMAILGSVIRPENTGSSTIQNGSVDEGSRPQTRVSTISNGDEDSGRAALNAPQSNAARSAEQYLSISGFSRAGLINQLSSRAGEGYSIGDATAAVDSLNVDWHENAARSAKQYLDMSGFSCSGLISQLSSNSGEKYTKSQATYGARKAGAC